MLPKRLTPAHYAEIAELLRLAQQHLLEVAAVCDVQGDWPGGRFKRTLASERFIRHAERCADYIDHLERLQ